MASYNEAVDTFRDAEYPQLATGKIYLDHAGTTLYATSLITRYAADLTTNLFGNPHSSSPPSQLSTDRIDAVRARALAFFRADPAHFDLVFVQNTTAAIKLVVEGFRENAFWYGYHKDSHSSLVGVREVAGAGSRCFVSDREVEEWIAGIREEDEGRGAVCRLFAYPGQSNMTGRRLLKDWPAKIRQSSATNPVYTLLDAAALATTCPLDLSNPATAPDFTAVAFYKIFGFPNLAALIVRKPAGEMLQNRRYFGGGTVDMVICVDDRWHGSKDPRKDQRHHLHDALEDGTLPFHAIVAFGHALDVHEQLFTSMKRISEHTAYLGERLYAGLGRLRHPNGTAVVRIYTDSNVRYGDADTTGATIAFNVFQEDGSILSCQQVERRANSKHIYLRTGGLCNPGGVATYLGLSAADFRDAWLEEHRCSYPLERLRSGKGSGVVRVSLGAMSTRRDVDVFLRFMEEEFVGVTGAIARILLPEGSYTAIPVAATSKSYAPTTTNAKSSLRKKSIFSIVSAKHLSKREPEESPSERGRRWWRFSCTG